MSLHRENSVAHTGSLTAYLTEIVPSFALAQYYGNQVLDMLSADHTAWLGQYLNSAVFLIIVAAAQFA